MSNIYLPSPLCACIFHLIVIPSQWLTMKSFVDFHVKSGEREVSLLYIDDDQMQRLIVSKMTSDCDLFSIQVAFPTVAYHLVCSYSYDIILLDYWLHLTT